MTRSAAMPGAGPATRLQESVMQHVSPNNTAGKVRRGIRCRRGSATGEIYASATASHRDGRHVERTVIQPTP
jgi:hypothetical protein